MKLVELLSADIYRDGGSYSADFLTDENLNYSIFLKCSKMPDEIGLHHKWLFEYSGNELPYINTNFSENFIPVLTGSIQEINLLKRLKKFVEENNQLNSKDESETEKYKLRMLHKMIDYILLREPCFPSELKKLKQNISKKI